MDTDFTLYNKTADLLKVLAHPVRLCILKGLIEKGGCSVGHMQACLNAPQSTTSQHLLKLKAAGIVQAKRNGLSITYSVCDAQVIHLINTLFSENK